MSTSVTASRDYYRQSGHSGQQYFVPTSSTTSTSSNMQQRDDYSSGLPLQTQHRLPRNGHSGYSGQNSGHIGQDQVLEQVLEQRAREEKECIAKVEVASTTFALLEMFPDGKQAHDIFKNIYSKDYFAKFCMTLRIYLQRVVPQITGKAPVLPSVLANPTRVQMSVYFDFITKHHLWSLYFAWCRVFYIQYGMHNAYTNPSAMPNVDLPTKVCNFVGTGHSEDVETIDLIVYVQKCGLVDSLLPQNKPTFTGQLYRNESNSSSASNTSNSTMSTMSTSNPTYYANIRNVMSSSDQSGNRNATSDVRSVRNGDARQIGWNEWTGGIAGTGGTVGTGNNVHCDTFGLDDDYLQEPLQYEDIALPLYSLQPTTTTTSSGSRQYPSYQLPRTIPPQCPQVPQGPRHVQVKEESHRPNMQSTHVPSSSNSYNNSTTSNPSSSSNFIVISDDENEDEEDEVDVVDNEVDEVDVALDKINVLCKRITGQDAFTGHIFNDQCVWTVQDRTSKHWRRCHHNMKDKVAHICADHIRMLTNKGEYPLK